VPADEWRPVLKNLKAWVAGPTLKFHGVLDDAAPVPFGPDWAGSEWSFRVLLDTDQNPSTGWYGNEYMVDGIYPTNEGLAVRLYQGGNFKAPACYARFVLTDRQFSFTIPLEAIKDDGNLDWHMVAGYSHWLESYTGSTSSPLAMRR